MKGIKISFKKVYLIYIFILFVASISSIIYVNKILHQYENMRPERCVESAITELAEAASDESFFTRYGLSEVYTERFEEQIDVKKEYLALFVPENMSFSSVNVKDEENVLYYVIENEGRTIAEVKLKAVGPAVTKLAVLNFREWEIEEIKPVLEKVDYTILVPQDFTVRANNIALTIEDGVVSDEKRITYTVSDVYLEPDFEIRDKDGNEVAFTVDKNKVLAEYYYYSLTLPEALTVHVNDELLLGEVQGNNRVYYDIQMLAKPEIIISDYYGNSISYEGKGEIPFTYMTVLADSRYSVTVDGKNIAKEAVTVSTNKEYEQLVDYVENLPQVCEYDVAILKKNAEILIKDEMGNPVSFESGEALYDLTNRSNALSEIPDEVSAEINILEIAQSWSLFMSNDKKFSELEKYFIMDSYQYNMALQYATGVDITYTSNHTLASPAFTGNAVTNFIWITDQCFSVDVYFVKHMILRTGMRVDDTMNNRFYFVKYDDTEDGIQNPTWKIVSMRENLINGN